MADEKAPSAQFEISIDGKPRSHRDRKDIAIETAEYLKISELRRRGEGPAKRGGVRGVSELAV